MLFKSYPLLFLVLLYVVCEDAGVLRCDAVSLVMSPTFRSSMPPSPRPDHGVIPADSNIPQHSCEALGSHIASLYSIYSIFTFSSCHSTRSFTFVPIFRLRLPTSPPSSRSKFFGRWRHDFSRHDSNSIPDNTASLSSSLPWELSRLT